MSSDFIQVIREFVDELPQRLCEWCNVRRECLHEHDAVVLTAPLDAEDTGSSTKAYHGLKGRDYYGNPTFMHEFSPRSASGLSLSYWNVNITHMEWQKMWRAIKQGGMMFTYTETCMDWCYEVIRYLKQKQIIVGDALNYESQPPAGAHIRMLGFTSESNDCLRALPEPRSF